MSKAKIAIVTDSTANLPANLIAEYNIHVIPQIINWEGKSYLDGIDITTATFYDKLSASGELPTTSQPAPGQFAEYFTQIGEHADTIVGVFISEFLSGTLASAHAGAAMMDDYPIEIVDSRSASLGLGLLTLAAARAAAQGRSHTEVAAYARSLVPNLRVFFVVDTLDYLHKGGRIGGAQRLVGSVLSIKPVLHLHEGRIEPFASVRTKSKAIQHMLDAVLPEMKSKKNVHAGVIHAAAPGEAQRIYDLVKQEGAADELIMGELSPVIGVHVGPGLVGMGYLYE